jgi:hypothetical protein
MTSGTTISRAQLARELIDRGVDISRIHFTDEIYPCPRLDWVVEFGKQIAFDRPPYTPGVFVCENFSRLAAHEADLAALKAGLKNHPAFGEFDGLLYPENPTGGLVIPTSHSLCIIRVAEGQLITFDAQCCEDPETLLSLDDPRCRFHPTWGRM